VTDKSLQSAGILSPTETEMTSPGTSSSAFMRAMWPSRTAFASLAEYSCSAAMAFSALVSWETPTTAFNTRMVRICSRGVSQCA
jgi:hypothetical protein